MLETVQAEAGQESPHQRQCIVTREVLPKERMIRFVVGPDGKVVPDVAGRLPGRGMWVKSSRQTLEEAVLKHHFSKAAKKQVKADDTLIALTAGLLKKRVLDMISLCRRSGLVITGFEKVQTVLETGKAAVLFQAQDASQDGKRKLSRYLEDVVSDESFTREELAQVVSSENPVHVVIKHGGTADALRSELQRLAGFNTKSTI